MQRRRFVRSLRRPPLPRERGVASGASFPEPGTPERPGTVFRGFPFMAADPGERPDAASGVLSVIPAEAGIRNAWFRPCRVRISAAVP